MDEDYHEVTLKLPKPPSLNQYYAGRHWSIRKRQKTGYIKAVQGELEHQVPFTTERFAISVRYNARYDVDNAIVCCKFVVDYLRAEGYVPNDTPKYFIKQCTEYDPSLDKDQFVATIKCYGYKRTE